MPNQPIPLKLSAQSSAPAKPLAQRLLYGSIMTAFAVSITACSQQMESASDDLYYEESAEEVTEAETPMAVDWDADSSAEEGSDSNDAVTTQSSQSGVEDNQLLIGSTDVTDQYSAHPAVAGKQLIVSSQAEFSVQNVVKTANEIERITIAQGGYVAQSSINNYNMDETSYSIGNNERKSLISYQRHATMVLRIPRENVYEFLQQVQGQIEFLQSSEFAAEDVSLDILRSQIEQAIREYQDQALQEQNLENDDEKALAGNVAVINQTATAKQRQMRAQLDEQALVDSVRLSTISLYFSQPQALREIVYPDIATITSSDQTANFAPRLWDNLKAGGIFFIEFVLLLSRTWPFFVAALFVWWLLRRMNVKMRLWDSPEDNKDKGSKNKDGKNARMANETTDTKTDIKNTDTKPSAETKPTDPSDTKNR